MLSFVLGGSGEVHSSNTVGLHGVMSFHPWATPGF